MAAPRRTRQQKADNAAPVDVQAIVQELVETFSQEALGLAVFLLGGYFGFSLFASGAQAWIAGLAGAFAWPLVISLLVLGAVLMLGERAGYWNPEAVVGVELLLLALAILAYIDGHSAVDWALPPAGEGGGLMGWGAGNVLIGLFGRWPAGLIAAVMAVGALILLYRHTPLIYLTPYLRLARLPFLRGEPSPAAPGGPQAAPADPSSNRPPVRPIDPAAQPTPPAAPPADDPQPPQPPKAQQTGDPAAGGSAPSKRRPPSNGQTSKPIKRLRSPEELPPTALLDDDAGQFGSRDTDAMAHTIRQTLWDFNIPVEIVNVESGPTVTQFGVQPQYIERAGQRRKVRVNRIAAVADDLALALAAPAIRIEAPVPGQPYVGIEVPNPEKTMVGMKSLLQSRDMAKSGGALPLALGRDTSGGPIVSDLASAPHMLIAGATGSGKSACINGLIVSLLMHHGPETLRFIMVDPKMVELPGYNPIPHMIGKAITDVEQVHGALTWLLLQMDDRYQLFRELKVRNITAYNTLARRRKSLDPLPYLVLIVDELADLMMTAPEEIERQLVRLAQMARATGIHLVIATQRPSTDVVTGLIKANFPTRIAFAVTSQIDSRVILDTPGAEKLLGQGDMLFMRPDSAKLKRVQGSYVNDGEIERVVNWWQERARQENPDGPIARVAPWVGLLDKMDDEDELLLDAMDAIRGEEAVSTSFVQRRLRIGYPRAARLMSLLESQGAVGPDLGGGRGREVLLKNEESEDESEEENL